MSDIVQDRLVVLSEMAQIQRRNAELAMSVFAQFMSGTKTEPEKPVFPETLRTKATTHMVKAFINLDKIDEQLLKLL